MARRTAHLRAVGYVPMNKENHADLNAQKLLKEKEVERVFGLNYRTLQDWRLKGCGPSFVKIGRSVFYRGKDIIAFLDDRTFKNTGEAAMAA